jgi:hypothetical protein
MSLRMVARSTARAFDRWWARRLELYQAWQTAGHTVEMHVYAQGGHGFAIQADGLPAGTWMDRYLDWLRSQGFLG